MQQPNSQKNSITLSQEVTAFFGPLPPPEILEKYNRVIPNAAERILKMAEDQTQHRQALEKKVINHDKVNSRLGIFFAFVIAISFIAASYFAAIKGHSIYGGIMGTGGLTSLVYVFIYGSKARAKERSSKAA